MAYIIPNEIDAYAERYTSDEPTLLQELSHYTWQHTAMPRMISSRSSGRFLTLLCRLMQARNAFEIGMFTGYSALSIAEGLSEDGKLITCDINHEYEKIARSHFDKSPHGSKITICIQDAMKTIAQLTHQLDFVFIDADKTSYKAYYEAILPKLRTGGVIVADNCLWSGKVLMPHDADSCALHAFNEFVYRDERVDNVLLTIRDGLNVITKR